MGAFEKQEWFQVAYLVNDIDESMARWSQLFGTRDDYRFKRERLRDI